uniref:Uncharacterized protein n=1 Tax=Arundo donax TaxID=35708 RepID=A0A0A8YX28_ARUDO
MHRTSLEIARCFNLIVIIIYIKRRMGITCYMLN